MKVNRTSITSISTPSFSLLFATQAVLLRTIVDTFANNHPIEVKQINGPLKLIEIEKIEKRPRHLFWGVHKDEQRTVHFKKLKQLLQYQMALATAKTVQIIGDSTPFSKAGTHFARSFLKKHLDGNHLVAYGYSGQNPTKDRLDINALVNEYVDTHPNQAYRFLANVVGHTSIALEQWDCYGSTHIHNFVVVFNDAGMADGAYTKFGDDVIMSDHLLNSSDGDSVVCLEGGVQSFKQVVNSLALDLPIEMAYNLRAPIGSNFFSTARFLHRIYKVFEKEKPPTEEAVLDIYYQYRKTLLGTWNASRPDHHTKQPLFEKALAEFIDGKRYKKIKKLCTFFDARTGEQTG